MRKSTAVGLIIATFLVIMGSLLFVGVIAMVKGDFTKLGTTRYVTNTYEIEDSFTGISVSTDTSDIELAVSQDGTCKVECYEEEIELHSVTVKDGILTVELQEGHGTSYYINNIGIYVGTPKITIYLPEKEYISLIIDEFTGDVEIPGDFTFKNVDIATKTGKVNFFATTNESVKIKGGTGAVRVENISVGSLSLSLSTGRITVSGVRCDGDANIKVSTGKTVLTDMKCKNLIANGSTGNASLNNVIAIEKFSIERSTGDVRFTGCDAAEIYVKTDTGDVTGSLLSDKVFITDTDTGSVNVPNTQTGGKCEITTDTGDIEIAIE